MTRKIKGMTQRRRSFGRKIQIRSLRMTERDHSESAYFAHVLKNLLFFCISEKRRSFGRKIQIRSLRKTERDHSRMYLSGIQTIIFKLFLFKSDKISIFIPLIYMDDLFLHILHEVEIWNYPLVFWIPAFAGMTRKIKGMTQRRGVPSVAYASLRNTARDHSRNQLY